jgi:hypothetical protein
VGSSGQAVQRRIQKYQPSNTNDKYRYDLTAKQQSELEDVLRDYLMRYGYL